MLEIGDIEKLKSIRVDDERVFPYIVSIMNGCFGKNFKSIYSCRSYSFKHIDDNHMVWFPKLAEKRNGTYKAPSESKGWLNILLEGGNTIIEEKTGDARSAAVDGDGGLPRYTFGKIKGRGYVFLGVFVADRKKCRRGHWEFKRVATEIDLRRYHGGAFFTKQEPTVIRSNEAADDSLISGLRHSSLTEQKDGFIYKGIPQMVRNPVKKDGVTIYPRDRQTAINALAHAHFICEVNRDHPTFIRKQSERTYTEPHHLIPLSYQEQFDVSLDVEENIVSLCSNCHNEIHYGRDADRLIRLLYKERKDALTMAGINVTYDDLLLMYGLEK